MTDLLLCIAGQEAGYTARRQEMRRMPARYRRAAWRRFEDELAARNLNVAFARYDRERRDRTVAAVNGKRAG